MEQRGFRFIAFEHFHWTDGAYGSRWAPFLPGQKNFVMGASDLWGNVAGKLGQQRTQAQLKQFVSPDRSELFAILDAASDGERLARSMSLTLRSLDSTVASIASFYQEELVDMLSSGLTDGRGQKTTRDQELFATVHSFFLNLGSVRDYLAAFIAMQIGRDCQKIDSMAKLAGAIRSSDVSASALLQNLQSRGYLKAKGGASTKWETSGWLAEASDLRNEFVHRRTYGQRAAEAWGRLACVDPEAGMFRYVRPLMQGDVERDALDVILDHYEKTNELLFACAQLSGHDHAIMTLTDDDIVSVEIEDE